MVNELPWLYVKVKNDPFGFLVLKAGNPFQISWTVYTRIIIHTFHAVTVATLENGLCRCWGIMDSILIEKFKTPALKAFQSSLNVISCQYFCVMTKQASRKSLSFLDVSAKYDMHEPERYIPAHWNCNNLTIRFKSTVLKRISPSLVSGYNFSLLTILLKTRTFDLRKQ